MKPLYKTIIVIWSKFDGAMVEIDKLATDALDGASYCSKQDSVIVDDPEHDPDWDGTTFFMDDEEFLDNWNTR